MSEYIDIVFDDGPSHVGGRFVEVEDETGASISVGEWVETPPYWRLRIERDKTIVAQSDHISKQGATVAEQAKRIEELEGELAKAMGLLDILTEEDPTDRVRLLGKLGEQTTKLALMQADRDKLREALRKYSCCRSDCEGLPYCTCGYEDIRVEFVLGDNGEESEE